MEEEAISSMDRPNRCHHISLDNWPVLPVESVGEAVRPRRFIRRYSFNHLPDLFFQNWGIKSSHVFALPVE